MHRGEQIRSVHVELNPGVDITIDNRALYYLWYYRGRALPTHALSIICVCVYSIQYSVECFICGCILMATLYEGLRARVAEWSNPPILNLYINSFKLRLDHSGILPWNYIIASAPVIILRCQW